MIVLYILIGIIIATGINLCIFIPKLKKKIKIDNALKEEKQHLLNEVSKLIDDRQKIKENITNLSNQELLKNQKVSFLEEKIEDLKVSEKDKIESNNNLIDSLNMRFAEHADRLSEKAAQYEEEYKEEYLNTIKDLSNCIQTEMDMIIEERNSLLLELEDYRNIVQAAIDANIRAEELKTKADFYKLQIPDEDLQEIKTLKEVAKLLRNKEPLNKVIWKVYYEKPTNDLIGRVVGEEKTTGIYKITNLDNGKCYVGQAVDIASRWKQHIKRGLGAEAPTRNKLYSIMSKLGVENFSFEIIEKCNANQLNEKEDYWQDYFKAISFGYSIK